MLQRLLVARSRDEVALRPPSYTSGHFGFQDTARPYGTRSMLSRRSRFSERLEVTTSSKRSDHDASPDDDNNAHGCNTHNIDHDSNTPAQRAWR